MKGEVTIVPAPLQGAPQFPTVPGVTLAKPRVTPRLLTATPSASEPGSHRTFDTTSHALGYIIPPLRGSRGILRQVLKGAKMQDIGYGLHLLPVPSTFDGPKSDSINRYEVIL